MSYDLPLHGGDIISASERYDIPVDQWIDLSTGINPEPYPVVDLPVECFSRLPYIDPAFNRAVANYYQCEQFIALSGTQAAIQVLPALLKKQPILLPQVGYQEHAKHWQKANVGLNYYVSLCAEAMIRSINQQLEENPAQHLLVINPNNPTAVKISKAQLILWAEQLEDGSYLIVDEAFIDLSPQDSVLSDDGRPANIIVLRSFGKFFGLAGIRLGFVFANELLLKSLSHALGLWQLNGPAQSIAMRALIDTTWHAQAIKNIARGAVLTEALFSPLFDLLNVEQRYHQGLFSSYYLSVSQALWLNKRLAKAGVLTRVVLLNSDKALLRIGVLSPRTQANIKIQPVIDDCCDVLRSNPQVIEISL